MQQENAGPGAQVPGEPRGALPEAPGDEPARDRYELGELLGIARALASERDIRTLLDLILAKARQITAADAGSVYVIEAPPPGAREPRSRAGDRVPKTLRFMLSQNDSLTVDFHELVLPVDDQSIVGKAALDACPINIPDLARLADSEGNPQGVRHDRSFDQRTGYRARSMLTVPMSSARGEVIGVIQLINRKRDAAVRLATARDFEQEVVAFDARAEGLAYALAAQAGICLENAILYDEIRTLFEGFVDASVTAIEARDPTTSGHSRRVATLSVGLAEQVDALSEGPLAHVKFSRDDLRQIEFAGVLHDFGKVGVRENVLVKAKKLYAPQTEKIRLRLDYARKCFETESLATRLRKLETGQGSVAELEELARRRQGLEARIERVWQLVLEANEPSLLDGARFDELVELASMTFVDVRGEPRRLLEASELAALQVRRGSLTEDERQEIERHVSHTVTFLETIPWGRNFRRIPHIAGAHHESMDGAGYPLGLKGHEIPVEARMLTIADIFDALTASDRPYKAAVPVGRALAILEDEVRRGRCDPHLFDVFVGAKVYERVL